MRGESSDWEGHRKMVCFLHTVVPDGSPYRDLRRSETCLWRPTLPQFGRHFVMEPLRH